MKIIKKLHISFEETLDKIEIENNILLEPEKHLDRLEYEKEQNYESEELEM